MSQDSPKRSMREATPEERERHRAIREQVERDLLELKQWARAAADSGEIAKKPTEEQVFLREVEEADLAAFFEHQRDPVAVRMAAFPPRDRDAFAAHWKNILADRNVVKRTILLGPEIVGNLVCWEQSGKRLVGYWLGRRFWNQGVASRALSAFVSAISARPLHAYVARTNAASIRVLEKCGFQVQGESRGAAPTGGEVVEELVYTLTGKAPGME